MERRRGHVLAIQRSVPQTLWKIRGERMEVAVAIGTDPATTFSRDCARAAGG
jgi:UbiD family decarboxylase